MKVCTKCQVEKSLEEFYFRKDKNSFYSYCKPCGLEVGRKWRKANLEKCRAKTERYRKAHPQRCKDAVARWNKKNPTYGKEWYKNNRDKKQAKAKEWEANNKHIRKEIKIRRKLKRKQATPAWADKEKMREIYKSCPKGFEVDHIIPLQGKLVSGLHVEYNLQHLPAEENRKKGNSFGDD